MIFNTLKDEVYQKDNIFETAFMPIPQYIDMESAFETYNYMSKIIDPDNVIMENAISNAVAKIIEFFKNLFNKIRQFIKDKLSKNKAEPVSDEEKKSKVDDYVKKSKERQEQAQKELDEAKNDKEKRAEVMRKQKERDDARREMHQALRRKVSDETSTLTLTNNSGEVKKFIIHHIGEVSDEIFELNRIFQRSFTDVPRVFKARMESSPELYNEQSVFKGLSALKEKKSSGLDASDLSKVSYAMTKLRFAAREIEHEAEVGLKKLANFENDIVKRMNIYKKYEKSEDEFGKYQMETFNAYKTSMSRLILIYTKLMAHIVAIISKEYNLIMQLDKHVLEKLV